jgi:branched-chain amino acid transport system ATP-binding protein
MLIWERKLMLRVENLSVYLGGLHILRGISLEVKKGEIVALVGSNGAGKTTFINGLSGLIQPGSGKIWFEERMIMGLPPHKRVLLGLIQVPEGRRIFADMTVLENLEMGGFQVRDAHSFQQTKETIFTYFPVLQERLHQLAKTLSGGEQQMLAIGRSLMGQPRMLMLDEPSLGLAPMLVKTIFKIIARINTVGVTTLLVEQNVRQALTISNRSYVIENGVIASQGDSGEMLRDTKIMKTYLGL